MLEACRGGGKGVCFIPSAFNSSSASGREGDARSQSAEARTCRLELDTRSGAGVHKVVR